MSCFSFLRSTRSRSRTAQSLELGDELSSNITLYTYEELRSATNGFSHENKIGVGGFGPVYMGRLRDGKMAAIKVLDTKSRQGVQEFLTEIRIISEVDHENLVKLYGCCVQDNQRILVYNYLENNSLAHTLLGSGNIHFSWRRRVNICIGVARGLAYLHEQVRPHIIHRDIKASNILLDKDLNPKISDFGLAKLIPPDATHISTRVAGTIGYLAPEYAMNGQVTRKADIYGFGVLLVEIVSGRSNTNTRLPVGEQYILERTWKLYERNELITLVDASLNGDFDEEQACELLKIGLICTQDSPRLRPSMSSVVQMLLGRKNIEKQVITKPGFIADLMDLKIRNEPVKVIQTSSNYKYSSLGSGSDNACETGSITPFSSQATRTAVYDRSMC